MADIWAEAVKTEPATHDLTQADYAFTPYDGGLRGSVACWDGIKPRPGDYLILRNGERSSRYRVTDMNPCWGVDPPTMWMAKLEFAPRAGKEIRSGPSETRDGATDIKQGAGKP